MEHSRAGRPRPERLARVRGVARGPVVRQMQDPFGDTWWIQQPVTDFEPDEIERRAAQPEFAGALIYVRDSLVDARR
jgi:hypothetical protein